MAGSSKKPHREDGLHKDNVRYEHFTTARNQLVRLHGLFFVILEQITKQDVCVNGDHAAPLRRSSTVLFSDVSSLTLLSALIRLRVPLAAPLFFLHDRNVAVILTRRQYRSCSGLQAFSRSRRHSPAMVVPLARVTTQSWGTLEVPNRLFLYGRPPCAAAQTALSKLAVGPLQLRFDALLRSGTRRLNMIYIVAGSIVARLTPLWAELILSGLSNVH